MFRFEARIARSLTAVDPAKEGLKCLVKASKGGLLGRVRPGGDVWAEPSNLFQLTRLSSVAHRRLGPVAEVGCRAPDHTLVCGSAFFERSVVELTVDIEALVQPLMLALGRTQPKLVSPSHAVCSHWCSMYRRTVTSDTYPTLAAKYELDQSTPLLASQVNSDRSTREDRPLSSRATSAGESMGRTRTKRWTWSGITSRATIYQPFSAAISSNTSFTLVPTRPPSSR